MTRKEKNIKGNNGKLEKAIFAGGCFWCMEKPFEQLEGVSSSDIGLYRRHNPESRLWEL